MSDFNAAVDTFKRPLTIYQEAQFTVITSDPNYNPLTSFNQNLTTPIQYTPIANTVSGRVLWDKQQELAYVRPSSRQSTEAQIKVQDATKRACRIKVDASGYSLLKTAKKTEVDGFLMDLSSEPRPHGLFSPDYWTFYFVRSS